MEKILYFRDVERVIKDYFIECADADMDTVETTEASAELCQRMEGVAFGLPGSRELQYLLCKVECIGGEELGNCPERRFGRCRSIERLESCQIYAITDYLLSNGVIVPPCRVGDTVYVISETRAKEAKVDTIQIGSRNNVIFVNFECDDDCEGCPFEAWSQSYCGEWDCGNQYGFAEIKADDFGKTVFLTKEAAEAAMKKKEAAGRNDLA